MVSNQVCIHWQPSVLSQCPNGRRSYAEVSCSRLHPSRVMGNCLRPAPSCSKLWQCQHEITVEPSAGNTFQSHTVFLRKWGLRDKYTIYICLKRKKKIKKEKEKQNSNCSAIFPPIFWPPWLVIEAYGDVPVLCWFLVCLLFPSIDDYFLLICLCKAVLKMLYALGSGISGRAKLQLLRERNYWNGRRFQFKSCCVCFCDLFA